MSEPPPRPAPREYDCSVWDLMKKTKKMYPSSRMFSMLLMLLMRQILMMMLLMRQLIHPCPYTPHPSPPSAEGRKVDMPVVHLIDHLWIG